MTTEHQDRNFLYTATNRSTRMDRRTTVIYLSVVGIVMFVCLFLPRYWVRTPVDGFRATSSEEGGVNVPREVQLQQAVRSDASSAEKCPNALIRHDNHLLLFRDSYLIARFASMDEYIAFTEKQQHDRSSAGMSACPVLFFQPEVTAQGKLMYRQEIIDGRTMGRSIVPGPVDRVVAFNALESHRIGNHNVGSSQTSALDTINPLITAANAVSMTTTSAVPATAAIGPGILGISSATPISDNPMDTNWGGVLYSQQAIDSGKYDHRTVGKPVV